MARVEKRIAKSNAMAGSQSTRAPATGSAAAGASGAQRPAVQRTASAAVPGKAGVGSVPGSDASAGTPVKSQYVPPIKPKSDISATSAVRPQGNGGGDQQQPAAAAARAASGGVSARSSTSSSAAASAASSSAASSTAASAAAPAAAAAFVNPADDESRPAAPGSLLDGDFDEAQNKRAFEEARLQWIAETSGGGNSGDAAAATKSKVQLVHDPDYSPAEVASSDDASSSASSSLLNGPAFNERESAKEFAEARNAWMQSLADEGGAAAAPKLKPAQAQAQQARAQDSADGMWDPSVALGGGASILFPSDSDDGIASASGASGSAVASVSSALRSAQSTLERSAKHSCYNCYKLFYSASACVEPDFPGRPFCSAECAAATAASTKIRCTADGCARSVLRSQGARVGGKFMCRSCADNGGRVVKPDESQLLGGEDDASFAAAAPPSVHSSCDSIPPASSSPEPEAEAEADADEESELDSSFSASNAQGSNSIPEAASPAHFAVGRRLASQGGGPSRPASAARFEPQIGQSAPLSRPTTASTRPPVDTSVIRVAPAGSGPPVVEFPDSDED